MDKAKFVKVRIMKLQQPAEILRELAGQPLSGNLSGDEKKVVEDHTKGLKDSSYKLNEGANRWQSTLSNIKQNRNPVSGQKQRTEMNQSFNLQ